MAGNALTNSFMLGTATVMIGPQASLMDLRDDQHSIGLVKNFTVTAEPTYKDLTQGVRNDLVYSTMTDNQVRASMEVYEYTAQNLAYALGLDGSAMVTRAWTVTTAIFDNAASTLLLTGDATLATAITPGSFLMIQDGSDSKVYLTKANIQATHAAGVVTVTPASGFKPPVGYSFPVGSKVSLVNRIDIGNKTSQPFFSAKVIGILPDQNRPVAILFPKIQIQKGFSVNFNTDDYGNMPFEFTPFELVSTDPFYSEFNGKGRAALFRN